MAILSADGTKILNNYDRFTGVPFNATKVTEWYDGSAMDDSKVDNAIYFKNRTSLGGGYSKRDFENVIDVKWFGAKGDGSVDETAIIQKALTFSQQSGISLYFPNGVYKHTGLISVGKSVNIIGDNAELINIGSNWAIDVEGKSGIFVPVTSIDTETVVNSEVNTNIYNVLNTAGVEDITAGSIIKIISDDTLTFSHIDEVFGTRKTGEYAYVDKIEGNRIFLTGKLRENTYTTNVRCVRVYDDIKFNIDGINFTETSASVETAGIGSAIRLSYFINPKISNVSFRDLRAVGIQLQGCLNAKLSNINGVDLKGDSQEGHYGYLINDVCSEGTSVISISGINCRHVYTTNTYIAQAGADLAGLKFSGRTYNANITNGFGFSCRNSPFDVHEASESITFVNCHTTLTKFGTVSQGAGFNFRALNTKAIGCTSTDDQIGFCVHEAFLNTVKGAYLIDCNVLRATQWAIRTRAFFTTTLDTKTRGVVVSGGYYESLGANVAEIRFTDITFENNVKLILKTNLNNTSVIRVGSKVTMRIDGLKIDLTGSTGNGISTINTAEINAKITGKNISINRLGLSNYAGFINGDNKTGLFVRVNNIEDDGVSLGTHSFTNLASDADYKISYRSSNGSSSLINVTFNAVNPTPNLAFYKSLDPVVTVMCLLEGTNANYELPVLTPNTTGQVIKFIPLNSVGSGNTLTIRHGAPYGTRNIAAQNIILSANMIEAVEYIDRGVGQYFISSSLNISETGFETAYTATTQTLAANTPTVITLSGSTQTSNGGMDVMNLPNSIITGQVNDAIAVDVALPFTTPVGTNNYMTMLIRVKTTGTVYRAVTHSILKGAGNQDYLTGSFVIPFNSDAATNGLEIVVDSTVGVTFNSKFISAVKVHKAK